MEYKPHDYQKYATEFIVTHPVAAVILQMGLGKTVCTLDAINQLMYDSFEVRKVLVIAPLRVAKVTWSDEIRKWSNLSHLRYSIAVGTEKERVAALNADADIYIINRENVQWLVEKSGVPFEYDMIVIDELSSFKNWNSKRFKAFIAHAGIYNLEQQYVETEEMWFANWDMGGAPWDKKNATAQRTFATSPHKFVDQWDTPILITHGEYDFRILASQGMSAFNAAKLRGVPAEMLIFPDESHWILKPQNGVLWQRIFFRWLDRWLKPQATTTDQQK